jgi:hypothetical protein
MNLSNKFLGELFKISLATNTRVALYLCVIKGNPNLIAYVTISHQGTAQDLTATLQFNFTSKNHVMMASIGYCIPLAFFTIYAKESRDVILKIEEPKGIPENCSR